MDLRFGVGTGLMMVQEGAHFGWSVNVFKQRGWKETDVGDSQVCLFGDCVSLGSLHNLGGGWAVSGESRGVDSGVLLLVWLGLGDYLTARASWVRLVRFLGCSNIMLI